MAAEGRKSARGRAGAAAAADRLGKCAVRAVAIGGDVAARRQRNADPAAGAARGARAAERDDSARGIGIAAAAADGLSEHAARVLSLGQDGRAAGHRRGAAVVAGAAASAERERAAGAARGAAVAADRFDEDSVRSDARGVDVGAVVGDDAGRPADGARAGAAAEATPRRRTSRSSRRRRRSTGRTRHGRNCRWW